MGRSKTDIVRTDYTEEIRKAFREAVDLILPYKCDVCGSLSDTEDRFGEYGRLYLMLYGTLPELHICGKCLSSLNVIDEDRRWLLCLSEPAENDPCPSLTLFMPFTYKGIVEQMVPKIKFGKKIELARFSGCLLGSILKEESLAVDLVVPVPLSDERYEERGFNQAAEIAYPIAVMNDIPFADNCLVRTRDTKRQAEINDNGERSRNVTGAFKVRDEWDVTGLTVIVVDDVATSGATLHEAAAAIIKAGAAKVLCVAFAGNRTVKNTEPF